jgi:hypothetical protein
MVVYDFFNQVSPLLNIVGVSCKRHRQHDIVQNVDLQNDIVLHINLI